MTDALPTVALSIRQPWAWLIVNGHKDIENRAWPTGRRGAFLVHASATMTRKDYADAAFLAELNDITLPPAKSLERGGIVGTAEITGCVMDSESPWFTGIHGFELANAKPMPFQPLKGRLGFFDTEGGTES